MKTCSQSVRNVGLQSCDLTWSSGKEYLLAGLQVLTHPSEHPVHIALDILAASESGTFDGSGRSLMAYHEVISDDGPIDCAALPDNLVR